MKFIVIEGLDGSGKTTQINLLQNFFLEKGVKFKYLHFPRTNSQVYGDLIARFLRGELGEINSVNPYLVALIYAGDRENAAKTIMKWKKSSILVLVDRYVYSNIAFQCAKLHDLSEKQKLSDWIKHLEYEYFKIPKPDLSFFLDVPFSFTKNKLQSERFGDDRTYLKGLKDIHEESLEFQENVKKEYLNLIVNEPDFKVINCASKSNMMLSPQEIFSRIISLLTKYNIVS